jgi:PAS domain S-box-containing protein
MRRAQQRLQTRQDTLSSTNLALENKVEAQSLLAAIVASSQDAIVSKTLDGIITSWNKGAERLFGYTAQEAIGQSIHMIVPPELHDQERDILERLRRGERIEHLDVERRRKDGSRVQISVTISPVYDRHGHIIGASKTARDITQRKQWEEELLRSAEALRDSRDVVAMAMTAGRMGAWTRDLTTNRAWWSPELADILGIDAVEGAADRAQLARLIHPDDQAGVEKAVDEAIARREDYGAEFRFYHAPSGEWRWMEARGKASYGVDGKPVMLFGLGIDITERRRTMEALQEADRRKDEFLATLAHELRNPLAPIASGLHILRSADDNSDAAAAARTIMERQVRQMVRLVDDLLDVARITTGKIELRCEPLNLADAINDAIETSRPLMTSRGQRLSTDFPAEPIYVNADRTRLAQVFANLLNNSAKYSEPEQRITIAVSSEGGDAVVRVRDEGIGIHA